VLRQVRQTFPAKNHSQARVGFESDKRSHRPDGFTDSKRLTPVHDLAFLASFDFVLAYFSGRFIDSIGLGGFVLQNFRFFFLDFLLLCRGVITLAA
jgi:hypothetical protein